MRLLLINLLVAFAYVVSGRLGLLLAIPPGYATAIFPPAGVALAALLICSRRVLPGILLGSFLMNLSLSGLPTSLAGALLPAGIAVGSSSQALIGHALLLRFCPQPLVLDDERSLLRFFVFAGLLATVVGATIGVSALYWAGTIPSAALSISWLTWWVGDAIGVLLITPLGLMAFGRPATFWRPQLKAIAPPLVTCLLLVVSVFFASSRWENEQLRGEFISRAERISSAIRLEFDSAAATAYSVERLFAASEDVDREEFRSFVARLIEEQPSVNAIEWAPRVNPAGLAAHQQQIQAQGFADYQVWMREESGRRRAVAGAVGEQRDFYPVVFAEPMRRHAVVLGFDLASERVRRETIGRALASSSMVVSGRIQMVQDKAGVPGVLVLQSVRRGEEFKNGEARDLVVVAVNVPETVTHALQGSDASSLAIRLRDVTEDGGEKMLFDNELAAAGDQRFSWSKQWKFGGRQWALDIRAAPDYVMARRSWQAFLVLLGGLMLTAMLGALLLLSNGRTSRVARLVDDRTAALGHSERVNSALTAASPDGILLAGSDGRISAANGAAEVLFGLPRERLVGAALAQLLPQIALAPINVDRCEERVHRFESTLRNAGGADIPVELTLTAVSADAQRVYSLLVRDLRARDELLRLKGEFISTVSHELRTPLTSIRGAIGLLAGGALGALPEAAQRLLETAGQNSSRLARLIDDLLDFEKLEAGGLRIDLSSQPLRPLLDAALAELTGFAVTAQVGLALDAEDALPPIHVAAERVAQVLANLLSNAIKFSPQGAVVQLRAHRRGDHVRIEVIDQGPGISAEQQPRVFSKFWQADGSTQRRHSGTGLGLAISKHLVERMNGRIGFSSQPGQGSTFWVEFPAA